MPAYNIGTVQRVTDTQVNPWSSQSKLRVQNSQWFQLTIMWHESTTHVNKKWNGEIMTHDMESNANDVAHLCLVKKRQ